MKYYKNSDADRFYHITHTKLKLHSSQAQSYYFVWLALAIITVAGLPLLQMLLANLGTRSILSINYNYFIVSLCFISGVPIGFYILYKIFADKIQDREMKPYVFRPQVIIIVLVTCFVYILFLLFYLFICINTKTNFITDRYLVIMQTKVIDEKDVQPNFQNYFKDEINKKNFVDKLKMHFIYTKDTGINLSSENILSIKLDSTDSHFNHEVGDTLKIFISTSDYFKLVLKKPDYNWNELLITSFPTFFNTFLAMWVFIVMILMPTLIKKRITKSREEYTYLYFSHFLKAIVFSDLNVLIGFALFICLSFIPGFLVQLDPEGLMKQHLINGLAFYSFWASSLVWVIFPILKSYFKLGDTLQAYSTHIIDHQILPFLDKHIIIIGTGNLGALLIKSCFFNIHPEGYGINTICDDEDPRNDDIIKDFSDYQIIIDKNLEIYLVSTRMIIIDSNKAHFKEFLDSEKEFPVGIIPPGTLSPKFKGIMILGICGDATNRFVLNAARADYSQLIINSTPDNKLSYKLALDMKLKTKSILSINDISSFDNLTSFTYDQPTYLIDTKLIEAITVAQRIVIWTLKYLLTKHDEVDNFKNIDKLYPKVLLVGNGKIIYYIIQALLMIHNIEVIELINKFFHNHKHSKKTDSEVQSLIFKITKKIVWSNLILLTGDEDIYKELDIIQNPYEKIKKGKWKFYPLRFKDIDTESGEFSVKTYYCDKFNNFENYFDVLKVEKPNLAVLISDKGYDSTSMFIRLSNAAEILKKDKLSIISYSHRFDKYFLEDQIKKYFTYNLDRNEIVGFPSQLPKESKIARDFVTANQYASMIRSLYENKTQIDGGHDRKVGEITCALDDEPCAIMQTICKMNDFEIEDIKDMDSNNTFLPSFIFGYSFDERRYKNTFIFTGTAKLVYVTKTKKNSESRVFINCDTNSLASFQNIFKDNMKCEEISLDSSNLNSPGMFKDCPITTMLRHKNKHVDLDKNKRLFKFNYNVCEKANFKNPKLFSNYAHYKIWADSRYPGSMAEALANVLLHKVNRRAFESNDIHYLPQICFSTSSPYPQIYKNFTTKGRFNIYSKLWNEKEFKENHPDVMNPDYLGRSVEDRKRRFNKGIINAIKIKKGESFKIVDNKVVDDSEWFNYGLALNIHLNKCYAKNGYSLFLIKKYYTEGIINVKNIKYPEKQCIEVSEYYPIKLIGEDSIYDFNEKKYDFCIGTCYTTQSKPNETDPNQGDDITLKGKNIIDQFFNSKNCISNPSNVNDQQYELVIIRKDVVKKAEEEFEKQNNHTEDDDEAENRKYQNMLFFIENL